MNGGRIEQIGTPRRSTTARQAGSSPGSSATSTSCPVTIGKARNGIAEVGLGGMRFPVRTAADVPAGPGHLALRHERIRIGPALGEARRGSAVIRDVVFSGPNVQYVLAAEGIELVAEAPYDGAGCPTRPASPSSSAGSRPPPACSRMAEPSQRRAASVLLAPVLVLLAFVFAAPLLLFLLYSVYRFRRRALTPDYNLDTYWRFLTTRSTTRHHRYAGSRASVTVLSVLIGYPWPMPVEIRPPTLQRWLGLLVFSPILVSVVVRSYGWTVLLADQGPVNYG